MSGFIDLTNLNNLDAQTLGTITPPLEQTEEANTDTQVENQVNANQSEDSFQSADESQQARVDTNTKTQTGKTKFNPTYSLFIPLKFQLPFPVRYWDLLHIGSNM